MKITGPQSSRSVSSAKGKGAAKTGGEGFSVSMPTQSGQTVATSQASASSAVSSVDAILALQGVDDFAGARQRATHRAFSLLDVLDELKIALLEGGIPKAKLEALMSLLQTRRDGVNDAQLEAALDEVEVRAAVELAKYSQ